MVRDPLSVWEAGSALALLVLVVVLLFFCVLETRNPDIVWSCDFGVGFFAVDLDALQAALPPFTGASKDLRRRAIAAFANHGHRTPPQLLRPPACRPRAELDMCTYPYRSAGTHCR